MKKPNLKPTTAWAIIQKKSGYEYKEGEVIEISLWRRNLEMHLNKKYHKVVKVLIQPVKPRVRGKKK